MYNISFSSFAFYKRNIYKYHFDNLGTDKIVLTPCDLEPLRLCCQ